jgi:hypothetical protein
MFASITLVRKAFGKMHVEFRFYVGLRVCEDEVDLARVPTVDDCEYQEESDREPRDNW